MKPRKNLNIFCSNCNVGHLCLTKNLPKEAITYLDESIHYVKVFEPNEHIYLQENSISKIYALRSGICKDYSIDNDGNEHINEFYFPGDILGLEYINKNTFQLNAVAIKQTVACVIPVSLVKGIGVMPELKHRLFEILCQKIDNNRHYVNQTNVRYRIAAFLLNLVRRFKERPMDCMPQTLVPKNSIPIQLSYIDISNKIGISNETFSRILKEFVEEELIVIQKNAIVSIDIEGLQNIFVANHF